MRITGTIALAAVLAGGAVAAAAAFAHGTSSARPAAPAGQMTMMMPMNGSSATPDLPAPQLARARIATAKYSNDLGAAKAAGYKILTQMIPGMGYHYLNASVKGFNVTKPPILVYEKHGGKWQLGALEWVFPKKPATPPLKGATYGSFPAACQYADGTFTPEPSQSACAAKSPQSGAAFTFWHPQLVTMHVWIWYPNPAGMYASMNPLVHAFN